MRGSIFGVVSLAVGLAMLPAILDVDVDGDATGETVMSILEPFAGILGPILLLAVTGLLVAFFVTDDF